MRVSGSDHCSYANDVMGSQYFFLFAENKQKQTRLKKKIMHGECCLDWKYMYLTPIVMGRDSSGGSSASDA